MEIELCEGNDPKPSELGTLDYWSTVYQREKNNFSDHGDPGEIWFGEESQERILSWLEEKNISKDKEIVDLGCGNGMMLLSLSRSGFTNLTGVDYCPAAVELAKSVAESHDVHNINFKVADLVGEIDISGFDIALDKGTYDAISLNPENAIKKRKSYIKNVAKLLKDDGLFIITSCNWIDMELVQHFNSKGFHGLESIPTPKFKFGGKEGSIVSVVVLQKKKM